MDTASFRKEVMQILGVQEREIISVSQETTAYKTAFDLYEEKAYRKASQLFTTLVLADPFAPHYWQGLAGSKQMAREYEAALRAWGLFALLRPQDPLPHFHAAECLLAMGETVEAEKALNAALAIDPSWETKINPLKRLCHGQD